MADIDMIPRSYRTGIRVRRVLRRTGLALAIVVLAGALAGGWLRWRTVVFEREAARLRAAAMQAQTDQAREASARSDMQQRSERDALLRALRREGELAALAQAIDVALPRGAWLTNMMLRRGSPLAEGAPIGSGKAAAMPVKVPASASIVELSGQALDYAAVTAFLEQLGRAPGVGSVQLRSSGAAGDTDEIAFDAIVTLAWEDRP